MPKGRKINQTARSYYDRLYNDLDSQWPASEVPVSVKKQKTGHKTEEVTAAPKFAAIPPDSHLVGRYALLPEVEHRSLMEASVLHQQAGIFGEVVAKLFCK